MKNKIFDLIVVGELNVDMILNRIAGYPEVGKEKIAGDMELTLGSSSAIFASNICRMGAEVSFAGKVGEDYLGDFVINELNASGVDTRMIIKDASRKTGVTVALNYDEDRAMITYKGAMESMKADDIAAVQLKRAKHMHVSSIFLQSGLKNDILTLFKKAKDLGLTTSLDTQWDPEEKWDLNLQELLPYVDVFLPNKEELRHLTGHDEIEDAVDSLRGNYHIIVVKLGKQGSVIFTDAGKNHIEAYYNDHVIDAIGAGDSFDAGFIYKFLQSESLTDCQAYGNLMGALSTTGAGGTSAFRKDRDWRKTVQERFHVKLN